MTTVVITQTDIAWDSQMTMGNERGVSATEKVELVHPGVILAFSGDLADKPMLEQWLREHGHDPVFYPRQRRRHSEFEAVIITRKGFFSYDEDSSSHGVPINPPYCLGSGAVYARSLLESNKVFRLRKKFSAVECVRLAGELDVNTGAPYKTMNLYKALYPRKVK